MKNIKCILVIFTLILSSIIVSCEKDPKIDSGNYLYDDGELYRINGIPIQWSDDVSYEVKETVWEIIGSMVNVEGGDFEMGGNDPDYPDEMPAHKVTLSGFLLSKVTVTQKQWAAIMRENPLWSDDYGKGDDYPANFISYNDALQFIDQLNSYSGLKLRLPTEAEWEYAACGGQQSHGYTYSGSNYANNVAWHRGNANGKMHPSADLVAHNELGLFDMSGNVWEWCSDWYGSYTANSATDPTGPATGTKRVVRGGSFTYDAEFARCKARNCLNPTKQSLAVGLRLAMDAD